MRFFSRPEGPPGASQPGDPLGVPADYHDLTLSPVWWYTRLFDLFDCDLDELKTLHMAIRESGRNPTVSGPDGQETLYIPTAVIHRYASNSLSLFINDQNVASDVFFQSY
jgi:hypothetical protein